MVPEKAEGRSSLSAPAKLGSLALPPCSAGSTKGAPTLFSIVNTISRSIVIAVILGQWRTRNILRNGKTHVHQLFPITPSPGTRYAFHVLKIINNF